MEDAYPAALPDLLVASTATALKSDRYINTEQQGRECVDLEVMKDT